ncbi:MAG: hypothetical protein K6E84_00795, partial [Lachnospiraceae bacterium]|nr:hypothetical protein [Lachnospiraceae bacterium]
MAEYSISAVLDGAGFQLSTILVGISCLYYTYIVNKRRNLQNKLFIMMLVNIVVTALCSLTASFLSPVVKGPGFAFDIYRLTQYVYFVVHPLLAPMFCFYVAIITGATRRMKSSHRFIYQSPMYLIILMALVNPFTHWIYDYTETYAYHRDSGVYVLYAVNTIYFAAAIVILFFFWDAVTSRIRKVLFFFVVLIAIGTVIQLVIDGVHTELICEALALTAIMFSVESEETRRDVNTGLLNSVAMSQDLRRALKSGQPFHMICIKMQNPLNLMQLIGQANIAKLTAMTGGFLTTLTEDETLYYVGPGTFVIRREGTDEEEDLQLARKIAARFRQPWDFQGRNNVFNAVVLFVRIPEDVIDMGDIMMLMNAPMPRGFVPTEDVCRGVGLDNILRQSRLEKNILEGLR